MKQIHVMFVDDEEDIRFTFQDRFEDQFQVHLASNGAQALEHLKAHPEIQVVVTDIRMPEMNGLELLRRAKEFDCQASFIVVSGHADSEDIILALRLGARNFLRKPYRLAEMDEIIQYEARRWRMIREEKEERERDRQLDRYLTRAELLAYDLPNHLDLVNHLAFRLVHNMRAVGVVDEDGMINVALGLIEIFTNAIEHGNLEISGAAKIELKTQGDHIFMEELHRRMEAEPYKSRHINVVASVTPEKAQITVTDQGHGFDVSTLLDPTTPENLFATSGRGILLARTFLDEVHYNGKGNQVTLVKHRMKG